MCLCWYLFLIFAVTQESAADSPTIPRPQITIFVHGTLPKFTDHIIHKMDVPWGLNHMRYTTHAPLMGRIGRILDRADHDMFPIEQSYLFGWSGHLSFTARRYEGRILYQTIRALTGDITLIGHSHGGNVALEVVRAAHEAGDTEFRIKRLILLAVPSQVATADFVKSPIFEEVISFYSHGDDTQRLDPQGIYRESKKLKKQGIDVPLFSDRYFPDCPHLIQIRVLKDKYNPGHLEFIMPGFLRSLPNFIKKAHGLEHNGAIHILNCCTGCGSVTRVKRRTSCTGKVRYVEAEDEYGFL
jgi:pimeloyl-ACP methyl ester carboxylesterase